MRPKDFEIPVGWGHIAGRAWGDKSSFPVLCVHGIQDNAGTFDRLIPLLPKRFFWVAVDLPGHGRSSYFESGHHIEFHHILYSLKVVINHFKWEKLYLIGHSLGAQLSTFFTSLYPELIVKTVLIDGLIPLFTSEDRYIKALRKKFNEFELLESTLAQKAPPSYSYDDAVDRLIKNRPNFILPESAKVLIKRSLAISGEGFRYSTDQRFKLLPLPLLTLGQNLNIIQSIKTPCLLIAAENTLNKIKNTNMYYSADSLSVLDSFPNFTYKIIPGDHDVHLNDPKSVAAVIIPFLADTQPSL